MITLTANNIGSTNFDTKALEAFNNVHSFVERQLKLPSSKFPDNSISYKNTKIIGPDRYHVASYVDSENKFGLNVRTYFAANIMLLDDSYRIEELIFE